MQVPVRTNQESWVHEKGLPHARRGSVFVHPGQRLLLATDLTTASRPAEVRALQLAKQSGARLAILVVVPPQGAYDSVAERRLAARLRLARLRGIEAEGWMVTGDPGECVVEASAAIGADAIIMGPEWAGPRTASYPCGHVVLHAPCRVLIVGAGWPVGGASPDATAVSTDC